MFTLKKTYYTLLCHQRHLSAVIYHICWYNIVLCKVIYIYTRTWTDDFTITLA